MDIFNKKNELVYITASNLHQIRSDCDSKGIVLDIENLYEKDLRSILSIPELNLLCQIKNLYENLDDFFVTYKKTKRIDTKRYVFEEHSPAYHFLASCENLHSDFKNVKIPPEIMHNGQIDVFRKFYRDNIHLLEMNEKRFYTRLEIEFNLKNPPKLIEYKNSGVELLSNYSLDELKVLIDDLISESEKFRYSSEETKKMIQNLGYGSHKVKQAQDQNSPLYLWHNKYKKRLKELLVEYFRVRFNPDLRFKKRLLEELGFVPCKVCMRNKK